jgi:hypothetical protein
MRFEFTQLPIYQFWESQYLRKWRNWQTHQLEGLEIASASYFCNNMIAKD